MTALISINSNPARRVLVPIVRCQIGVDIFMSGDGSLMSASVTLGEGDRSSRCSFELYDPFQQWAQKYFSASYEQGGLVGIGTNSSGSAAPVGQIVGGVGGTAADMTPRRKAFLDMIALAEGTSGQNGYKTMFTGKQFSSFADHPRAIQGGGRLRSDAAGRYQFLSTTWDGAKRSLGLKDFTPASQDKACIWKIQQRGALGDLDSGNFEGAVNKLNLEWASLPGSPYGQPTKSMSVIKAYYNQRLKVYQNGGQAQEGAKQSAVSPVKEATPQVETADKGCQIIISMGYEMAQLVDFSFIHTGSRFSGTDKNITSFEGQSVRWLLSRRTKNTTYQGITLRQLSEKVANSYGLKLEMVGDGPKFEHLDQTGMSDFKLLQRECDRIGYRLYDKGAKLIVEPRHSKPLGFVLEYGVNMDSFECTDSAQKDSSAGATASQPSTTGSEGEIKTVTDPLTGALEQKKQENKAATGLASGTAAIAQTGAAIPTITPKLLPVTPTDKKGRKKEKKEDSKVLFLPGVADKPPTAVPKEVTDEATAQTSKESVQRVKGFPGSATFTTTDAALTVAPDTPFVTEGLEADFFNRVWAIDTVTHTYQGGNLKTSIKFYSPMLAPVTGSVEATITPNVQGSNCNQRILNAANALRGMNTKAGPDGGNNACVWAINKVLAKAGVANPWGTSVYVPTAEQSLKSSGAQKVPVGQSIPGDIVIWDDGVARGHIGVVTAAGGAKVLSNSSSRGSFAWEAPNSSYENFYRAKGQIYRVKC